MRRLRSALACAAFSAILLASCRAPTEITVALSTNFACADLQGAAVIVGQLHEIETKPSALVTTFCEDVPGQVGSVVLVPSGAKGDQVAFKIVAGVRRTVDDCLKTFGPGCIVARRALRYLPHTPLLVPVLLSGECNGVECGDLETCSHGSCAPAEVDPSFCVGPVGCPEGDAGPATPDTGAFAAVPDAASPTPRTCNDLVADAGSPPSGAYTIDPDGPGPIAPFQATCDMVFGGGGWTLIESTIPPNGTANGVAGTVTPGTSTYMPAATLTALATISRQVHVRSPNQADTKSITSLPDREPIVNLRALKILNYGLPPSDATADVAPWTGPYADIYHVEFFFAADGNYPEIFYARGNGQALHLRASESRWAWVSATTPNEPLEVYVR